MEITTVWSIASADYEQETGRILRVHYEVTTSDGDYRYYRSYGSVNLRGDVVLPYEALTEELMLSWVQAELGEVEVAAIEQVHMEKMALQESIVSDVYGSGLPWA